ncbi:DUF4232 domain-containing protein [Streptomyces griseoviridis]|jgi:hypothetical protein|uniref:DUF4232 domain-containing protein n=2 Tax=Streptomyces griseoviridis TaxID=45398 RepID=A0ABT9LQT0_STRGD|nr:MULTISPECIES: DUF4232 domain-containing protein [Streptomyces]MDP9685884.1 hypothetical protein [Streptomyces griseoviridis]GGS42982.1 lipoprotein [Streptomyces niveoruber]GGS77890.1 lipoprotein [Streptomyces griseoviridis]
MANTHRTALLGCAVALLGALTACGAGGGGTAAPVSSPTATATARETAPPGSATASATGAAPGDRQPSRSPSGAVPGDTAGSASASGRTDGRCRTADLRASVGRVDAGAGQRNVPVVLTNTSARTCTLYGYPGAAFVDGAGRQLGPDPVRETASPRTVSLAPGRSAWAALSFAAPQVSGARAAEPAALLVTPPDERAALEVPWQGGEVPVGGNESAVSLTVLAPGTGP